jgi:hypothetical protein
MRTKANKTAAKRPRTCWVASESEVLVFIYWRHASRGRRYTVDKGLIRPEYNLYLSLQQQTCMSLIKRSPKQCNPNFMGHVLEPVSPKMLATPFKFYYNCFNATRIALIQPATSGTPPSRLPTPPTPSPPPCRPSSFSNSYIVKRNESSVVGQGYV